MLGTWTVSTTNWFFIVLCYFSNTTKCCIWCANGLANRSPSCNASALWRTVILCVSCAKLISCIAVFACCWKNNNIKKVSKFKLGKLSFKGALLRLRRFLATESPLKTMKNGFYFTLLFCFYFIPFYFALSVLKILKFLSRLSLVMPKNDSIKKLRLNSKFMTSQPG